MRTMSILAMLLCALPVAVRAADVDITLELPRLQVAEYHRPYAALWVENDDHEMAASLAVWYDQDARSENGAKWLPDLRQWWRRGGRGAELPIDGVTGATRPAGRHRLRFHGGQPPLGNLPAGHYQLVIEAAREVGGREVVRIPFEWPATKPQHLEGQGKSELGRITLDINP